MLLTKATADLLVSAKPVGNGTEDGEVRVQRSPHSVLWVWNSTANDWQGQAMTPILYAGNPNSNVTSDCAGQLCINSTSNAMYYSAAANSTAWTPLGTGGGGQ